MLQLLRFLVAFQRIFVAENYYEVDSQQQLDGDGREAAYIDWCWREEPEWYQCSGRSRHSKK